MFNNHYDKKSTSFEKLESKIMIHKNLNSTHKKTTISILHSADWHLGSRIREKKDNSQNLIDREREKLEGLLTLSIKNKVDLWLLAGDLIEAKSTTPTTITLLKEIFEKANVPIFIACGNHDPLYEDSIWKNTTWPPNVYIFSSEGNWHILEEFSIAIFGVSFSHQYENDSLLTRYQNDFLAVKKEIHKINSSANWIFLTCIHGQIVNNTESSPYNPLKLSEIQNSPFSYLALGHIHTQKLAFVNEKSLALYSTSLIPRGFKDGDASGAIIINVSNNLYNIYPNKNLASYEENYTTYLNKNLAEISLWQKKETFSTQNISASYFHHNTQLFIKQNLDLSAFNKIEDLYHYLKNLNSSNTYFLNLSGTVELNFFLDLKTHLPLLISKFNNIKFNKDNLYLANENLFFEQKGVGELINKILLSYKDKYDEDLLQRVRTLLWLALEDKLKLELDSSLSLINRIKDKWQN